jgi:hypothetical protein
VERALLRELWLDSRSVPTHRGAMRCLSCGKEIELSAGERIGFSDGCERCGEDLHTCLNCRFHDPAAYNECRESSAERVRERDRANRCEYFAPGERQGGDGASAREAARSALDDLFKKG